MLQPNEIQARLSRLGLRLPVDTVREAVQRLKNGESLYSLYGLSDAIVAKATAAKIRGLWNQGKLSFVLDVSYETRIAEEASEDSVLAGNPFVDFNLVNPVAVSKRLVELLPQLPTLDWTVEALERVGIEAGEALEMMTRRDEFLRTEWAEGKMSRAGLTSFVELHYVFWYGLANTMRTSPAPFQLIRFAARNFATGLVDDNLFMRQVALDVLRYQVWRGSEFLQAFQTAQMATSKVARRRSQDANEELDRILSSHGMDSRAETPEEENIDG